MILHFLYVPRVTRVHLRNFIFQIQIVLLVKFILPSLRIVNFNIISTNINVSNFYPVCDISISFPPRNLLHVYETCLFVAKTVSQSRVSWHDMLIAKKLLSSNEEFQEESLFSWFPRGKSTGTNLTVKVSRSHILHITIHLAPRVSLWK